MANQSKYTPEELAHRIDEILSGAGEPYQPGEDPLVDAAMRLNNTVHPVVSDETIAAIGAGLVMANHAAGELPSLSNDAFNEIAAKLQAQAALQAAPQPVMSDEAFNRIAMELQLRNAPKPVMNDATLLRIEQQLVQAARPGAGTGYLTIVAMLVIAVVGGLLALTVMLNYDGMETVPRAEVQAPSATPQDNEPAYTTTINVAVLPSVVGDTEDEQPPTEMPTEVIVPTVEPTAVPEIVLDEPETLPHVGDIIHLPSAIVTEGTIEAIDEETLMVYGMSFTFAHDPSIADGYDTGDMVRIEGTVNPLNPDVYVIAAIEPVIDTPDERPVLVSIGVEPDPDDETTDDDTDADVTVTTSDTTITGSTGTSTTDEGQNDDECRDGDDRNQGRGQECNQGRGSSGQGRGRP